MEQSKIECLKALIDRFFEGVTTNEEERELSILLSEKDLPQELIRYRSLFAYFENELEQELCKVKSSTDISDSEFIEITKASYKEIKLHRRLSINHRIGRRLLLTGTAALLLIFLSVSAYHIIANNSDDFDPYEGSFIVKNGVKITDLSQIRPELEATMEHVLYKEQKAELEFLLMEYEQQSKYINFINSFPEGPAREEVIKTFEQINR
jgi:hypothetical protein